MLKDLCKKCANPSLGLFLLRLALAAVFINAGWGKLQNIDAVAGFFGSVGLAPFFAYLVAWVELLGGISILLGVWTHISGSLLSIIMIVATYLKMTGKFGPEAAMFANPMGYQLDLVLLAVALAVVFSGPGKYSVKGGCCGGTCESCKVQG